jgi:hypothetical protein
MCQDSRSELPLGDRVNEGGARARTLLRAAQGQITIVRFAAGGIMIGAYALVRAVYHTCSTPVKAFVMKITFADMP